MSEIQRLECELFDAEVHLDNAKTYIQMKGVNYHTLSIYLEASDRVQKIKTRLQELQHESWEIAGRSPAFFMLQKGEMYWKIWQNVVK